MDVQKIASAMSAASPVEHRPAVPEHREMIQAVRAVNSTEMLGADKELSFSQDVHSGRPVIRIVDRNTKEVITQVPAEYVLQLARDLKSAANPYRDADKDI
jgi:flagellar protein FlaG